MSTDTTRDQYKFPISLRLAMRDAAGSLSDLSHDLYRDLNDDHKDDIRRTFEALQKACIEAGIFAPVSPDVPPTDAAGPQKPYAYEYARSNGDDTYSVVIDQGSMIQVCQNVYVGGPPRNALKERPVKCLYVGEPPKAMTSPPGGLRIPEGQGWQKFTIATVLDLAARFDVIYKNGAIAYAQPSKNIQWIDVDSMRVAGSGDLAAIEPS